MVLSTPILKADEESGHHQPKISILSLSSLCHSANTDKSSGGQDDAIQCNHHCVITTFRSSCLLWCRMVAVGAFMTEFHVWTLIVFGVHWCIALLWLVLQDSASESGLKTPSPAVSLFRRALVAYLLVFDWPPRYHQHDNSSLSTSASFQVTIQSAGSWLDVVGVGGQPRSVAIAVYYGFTGVENAAMLSLWFHLTPASDLIPSVARLTTLASCTAAFTLGVLCVIASTQGIEDQDTSNDYTQEINATSYTKADAGQNFSVTNRCETETVIAEIHRAKNFKAVAVPHHAVTSTAVVAKLTKSALNIANHHQPSNVTTPETHSTALWERASVGDESSNSRNTNTLEGILMGSGSGSGLGIITAVPSTTLSSNIHANQSTMRCISTNNGFKSAQANDHNTGTLSWRNQSSIIHDTSTFTESRASFSPSTLMMVKKTPTGRVSHQMVKRPYVCSPRSSTPRIKRRNSSRSSLPSIKQTQRTAKAIGTRKRREKHLSRQCKRKEACHCKIFDLDQELDMGIVIKEYSKLKSASVQKSTRLNQGFETDPRRQFKILCATCLGAHDPLLTNCPRCVENHDRTNSTCKPNRRSMYVYANKQSQTLPAVRKTKPVSVSVNMYPHCAQDPSQCSTDYPSDTEITCTLGSISSSTSTSSQQSDATYTTWPPTIRMPTMECLLSEIDLSPWNYINAWLTNSNNQSYLYANNTQTNRRRMAKQRIQAIGRISHIKSKRHKHHHAAFGGIEDGYTPYCTVPPRLGKSVKELSFIKNKLSLVQDKDTKKTKTEPDYSSPPEIVV